MLVYIFILTFATTNEEEDNNNRTQTEQREEKIKSEFNIDYCNSIQEKSCWQKGKENKKTRY